MRLQRAQVQKFRSIKDTGLFDIEPKKTILVGPNEAGKSVLLRALQQINPPEDVPKFDALRDYPRSEYNDISTGKVDPAKTTIVTGYFVLEDDDKATVPEEFRDCQYITGRRLNNSNWDRLEGGPKVPTLGQIKNDLKRIAVHMGKNLQSATEGASAEQAPSGQLESLISGLMDDEEIKGTTSDKLKAWLTENIALVSEGNATEIARLELLQSACEVEKQREAVLAKLRSRVPIFVLFNNYFRVRPTIHLEHLAKRIEQKLLDDDQYDYGNTCLLKFLGFTAKGLSDLGNAAEPPATDQAAFKAYRDQLDERAYQLNAASVRLSSEIRTVWNPDPDRPEADRLRITADGQYLKVVVEDELGVDIELDQRSEGFQWLVSFFIVFFAEAGGKHKNAILLLDEPGLSLHGLKQREFRETISRLAKDNQTIYTTHSPFLVGPDELDLVRVVEMTDRKVGTKVHAVIAANDSASLLPLQEALGYDLAQSLFAQHRNLVLEGLTDYWYLEATAELLRAGGVADLNDKIALIIATTAGKVVYFATILHAHNLKVAALLDSDSAGDQAAKQDVLVHKLGNKRILRTRDAYTGSVSNPEIEDLLRKTLIEVAKSTLGWDVSAKASTQPGRPIVDIFAEEIPAFSKYKLAKAYVRWTRDHTSDDLEDGERKQWTQLINKINTALK